MSNTITLRLFEDDDIVLLKKWLYTPHVAEWYKHPEHWLNEIRERRGAFSFITHFIALADGVPFGFCQYYDTYFAREHEIWNDEPQISLKSGEIYSIDYLIGESEHLRRGYGAEIVRLLCEKVWETGAKRIIVEPETGNIASNKTLESNGFAWGGHCYELERPRRATEKFRCFGQTPLYMAYHDNEWGRPEHDDNKLFEMLILEGAQAGLSWETVLNKRENYRAAFDSFDPRKVAFYDDVKIAELMQNAGIIRNRLKINAAVTNAKLFLEIQEKYESFDRFIWVYVDGKPIVGHWDKFEDMPTTTTVSDRISKDLKKIGFKFVGSTIIYSFMQAVGMVNDHLKQCFVYEKMRTEGDGRVLP